MWFFCWNWIFYRKARRNYTQQLKSTQTLCLQYTQLAGTTEKIESDSNFCTTAETLIGYGYGQMKEQNRYICEDPIPSLWGDVDTMLLFLSPVRPLRSHHKLHWPWRYIGNRYINQKDIFMDQVDTLEFALFSDDLTERSWNECFFMVVFSITWICTKSSGQFISEIIDEMNEDPVNISLINIIHRAAGIVREIFSQVFFPTQPRKALVFSMNSHSKNPFQYDISSCSCPLVEFFLGHVTQGTQSSFY